MKWWIKKVFLTRLVLFITIFLGVVCLLTTPKLLGQNNEDSDIENLTHEIPQISGGAQIGITHPIEIEDLVIGPDFSLGVTPESKQVTTPDFAIGTTFEGFGFDDNATENPVIFNIPADSSGATGTDRLVAVVNSMIEARTKTGSLIWRDGLTGFFSPLSPLPPSTDPLITSAFDPKVIYDHFENRFLVVAIERIDTGNNPDPGNSSRILLAVSKTDSPGTATASDWNYIAINSELSIGGLDTWADYPGFEVDEEAVYITFNMFTHPTIADPGTPSGVRLWIIDKGLGGGFYDGGAASFTVLDPYAAVGLPTTTMPCHVFGTNGVGQGIGTFLVSSGISNGVTEAVQVVRVDDPLGSPGFAQEFVDIGDIEDIGGDFGFPELPDAPQMGTLELIEVNDRRALDCVWRDGRIWMTTTIEPNSGPDAGQTTAHWVKLNTSAVPGGPITFDDQGHIGGEDIASGTFTFFPAVAVNSKGDAKFGFSASAPNIFPGAFVAGREAGDPPGTVQASETVHVGEDFYIRRFGGSDNRWGDYSGIALDPTNDNVFWVFNQFADQRGTILGGEDGRWGTAWASCTLDDDMGGDGFAPGDANGDGNINILDVTVILNDILEISSASGNGDCNEDGEVNILDVTCVLNIILEG